MKRLFIARFTGLDLRLFILAFSVLLLSFILVSAEATNSRSSDSFGGGMDNDHFGGFGSPEEFKQIGGSLLNFAPGGEESMPWHGWALLLLGFGALLYQKYQLHFS